MLTTTTTLTTQTRSLNVTAAAQHLGVSVETVRRRLRAGVLAAYRWQYILSGVEERRFQKVLRSLITDDQFHRIEEALAPLAGLVLPLQEATSSAQLVQ